MGLGYDKWPLNHGLLLHLTFEEMIRTLAHDRAKPYHPHTLHGVPTWHSLASGIPYLDFDSTNPDYLDCPAANALDLNFTAGDFSGALWIYRGDLNTMCILNKQDLLGDLVPAAGGWRLSLSGTSLRFSTLQIPVAVQATFSGPFVIPTATWILIGFSRSGAVGRIFVNGSDVTGATSEAHIDPTTSAAVDLNIGILGDKVRNPFYGRIAGGPCGPRIWGRYVTPTQHKLIFDIERHLIGV